jgi:uncharacterized Ntn-hydrolase superfamily protein
MRRGTYSIVAHDPETGETGVAVQSHWFSVGSIVSWGEPGVGAVATQSLVEPAYGPRALALMRDGASAPDALARLVAEDAEAAVRQVAVVDAQGRIGVHTGERCIAHAGHETGEGFSCQANMMGRPSVWPAMAAAYREAQGSLADRLMLAMEAAEAEGGDVRGRQSAAILVVPAEGEPWQRVVELRVEDHRDPITELWRLVMLDRAYKLAGEADTLSGEGRTDEAAPLYERSSELAPENDELLFWAGLAAAQAGDLPTGLDRVRRAIEVNPGWAELLERLEPDIAPGAPVVRDALRG